MLGRAGNALDQAILLAGLIRDAGFDARIVRGQLTDSQAATLIEQMRYRPPELPAQSLGAYKQALTDMIQMFAGSPEAAAPLLELVGSVPENLTSSIPEIMPEIEGIASALAERLSQRVEFDPAAINAELREEAKDYFWVQYRDGAADLWVSAHPSFAPDAAGPGDVAVTATFTSAIPDELQHRVRFEIFIEQLIGGTVVQSPIMPAWERPAANLIGVPISFYNQPDGLTIENISESGSYEGAVNRTQFFIPVFAGEVPDGGRFFGLSGFTAPADVAGTPFAAIFQTIGSAVSDAAGALANLGGSEASRSAATLVGQTIHITLLAPGGAQQAIERVVWRESSTEPRDEEAIRSALATRLTWMVTVGRYPEPWILRELLESFVRTKPLLQSLIRMSHAASSQEFAATARTVDEDYQWLGHLLAFSLFDSGADQLADLSYRPSPTIAAYRQPLNPLAETAISFDVLANERHVVDLGSGEESPSVQPAAAVRIGVWESLAEQVALMTATGLTSAAIFRRAADDDIPLHVLSLADSSSLSGVDVPDNMRDAILADLEKGYVVVVPEHAPQSLERTAWWRVDPKSGNTLGFLESGIGGAFEHRVLMSIAFGAIAGTLCTAALHNDGSALTNGEALRCYLVAGMIGAGGISAAFFAQGMINHGLFHAFMAALSTTGQIVVGASDNPGLDTPLQ